MNPELSAAQAKLDALMAEEVDLRCKLSQVDGWQNRLRELIGSFGFIGEIRLARLAVRDAEFPVYKPGVFANLRITAVDEKWITMRYDRAPTEEVARHNRTTGRLERARSDRWNIDPAKALAIWEQWQAKEKQP